MDKKDYAVISMLLIESLIKYGPMVFLRIAKTIESSDITPAKIRELFVDPPESYFEEIKDDA